MDIFAALGQVNIQFCPLFRGEAAYLGYLLKGGNVPIFSNNRQKCTNDQYSYESIRSDTGSKSVSKFVIFTLLSTFTYIFNCWSENEW